MDITVQIMQILKNNSVSLSMECRGRAVLKWNWHFHSQSVLKRKGIGNFSTLWCYNTFKKYVLKTLNVVINSRHLSVKSCDILHKLTHRAVCQFYLYKTGRKTKCSIFKKQNKKYLSIFIVRKVPNYI